MGYDSSKLRSLEVVEKLIEENPRSKTLLKKLKHEKRLIIMEEFFTNKIDFKTFKKKIEEM